MVFSKLNDFFWSSDDAEKDLSEVTVEIRYYPKTSQYVAVYDPPTNNRKCGFGETPTSAFGKLDIEQGFLTKTYREQLRESEPFDMESELDYSETSGEYTLTLSRNGESISASGLNMSTVFSNLSEHPNLDQLVGE